MNNQARLILQQCIRDYGTTIGREPQRLEALLKDYAKGQFKREIFVYVQSARENVVDKLLDKSVPVELSSSALVQRLHDDYGLDLQLARWGVESWAFALNLSFGVSKPVAAPKQATAKNIQDTLKSEQDSSAVQPAQGNLPNLALIDGRYLDNGDGTVTDQQTGLQWMRCALGQTCDGKFCLGKSDKYDWSKANKVTESLSFAGFNDWRLPTIDELKSIIENESSSINYKAFPNTPKCSFWSSSPSKYYDGYACYVTFCLGNIGNARKIKKFRVRLVRGGKYLGNQVNEGIPAIASKPKTVPKTVPKPVTIIKPSVSKSNNTSLIDGRYLENGDGTVTDQKTGLQWMRCSLGQSWDGTTCQGEAKTYNWNDSNQIVKKGTFLGFTIGEKFSFAGYYDWRIPTIDELKSIIEKNKSPSINHRAFPITPKWFFWSSSPHAYHSSGAWSVHFDSGNVGSNIKSINGYVRLVRGGQ